MISAVDSLKYLLLGAHVMLTVAPHQMSVADRIKTQRHRRQKTLACKAVPIFVGCMFGSQSCGMLINSMASKEHQCHALRWSAWIQTATSGIQTLLLSSTKDPLEKD
jgi:amino acid permease